ncbi:MAG: hypothetical protein ACUVWN_07365 [bacterium]
MKQRLVKESIVSMLDFSDCPEGKVLNPLAPKDDITKKYFSDWTTPLAPRGGFNLDSGLEIVKENDIPVLYFAGKNYDRAIVYEPLDIRDCHLIAEIKPIDAEANPHDDRNDCSSALIGIVFRINTSRSFYWFGIEGKKRAVLYRRIDDEWYVLAEKPINLEDKYITLEVILDCDGIKCCCKECDVEFFCTDTLLKSGKVGVRSIGKSYLKSFKILQTSTQLKHDKERIVRRKAEESEFGKDIPDEVLLKILEPQKLGGHLNFYDFHTKGRYDILISGKDSLKAMTFNGDVLWETSVNMNVMEFSTAYDENLGRLIYGFTGERFIKSQTNICGVAQDIKISDEIIVIRGKDGAVTARRKIPELDKNIRMPDFAQGSGNFTNSGGFDIVLREWRDDLGGGGRHLWAYDKDLNPLWEYEIKGAYYGHHYAVQFYDIDSDGRDELLAGGTLLDAEGNVIWVHDRDNEMLRISGAHHYDAVALGAFSADEEKDPIAFLLGGSAGVYIVDGLNGKTRAFHRIGHAQGRTIGRVRADMPGEQILAVTRWGNMGILTLFSGSGDRLWTIQPDYIGQGAVPVQWGNLETKLIWTNTTFNALAFYDGYGRRVKELEELKRILRERSRAGFSVSKIRIGTEQSDYLCLAIDGKMYIFGPKI